MTQYRRGANFEREIKKYYEAQECFAIRAAGSHGVADLVVFFRSKKRRPLLIQAKLAGHISTMDRLRLAEIADTYHCHAAMAYKEKGKLKIEKIR